MSGFTPLGSWGIAGISSTRGWRGVDDTGERGPHRKIVYLLESAATLWGGVKIALAGANLTAARGHDIVVLSLTEPPDWIEQNFEGGAVASFDSGEIPSADLVCPRGNTGAPRRRSGGVDERGVRTAQCGSSDRPAPGP